MKRFTLYIIVAVLSFIGFTACEGRVWDTDEDLRDLSRSWAREYIDLVLDQKISSIDSSYEKKWSVSTAILKDTLYKEIHNTYSSTYPDYDSVDVTSFFIQIRDSLIVKVDGYRFSKKYWAHLFTIDEGIVDYEGKFHVDFYENGKTMPWAWSETTYKKNNDRDSLYYPYWSKTEVGWY